MPSHSPATEVHRIFLGPAATLQVTLFENPNFGGRSVSLGVGQRRFFTPATPDFNDVASSIRVPAGLVVVLYTDADDGGGYGLSVDLLEDCPDLSTYHMPKAVSYVSVFTSARSDGLVWARALVQNGTYVPGHWERQRADGTGPANPGVGAVSPRIPPHTPPVTTSIQVTGTTAVIATLGPQNAVQSSFWQNVVANQFGVVGNDFDGAEELGSAAFERASNNVFIPDSINFWYPQKSPRDHTNRYFKRTLIGTLHDAHLAPISGTYVDHDLNIDIAPDDAYRYMITEGFPRTYTDIMSAEWNGSFHTQGHPSCDRPEDIAEFQFVEAEVLPSSDLTSGVNEGLRDRINATPNRKIAVHGPWIYDKAHCCHAEIHPAEQIWWREPESAGVTKYQFNVICDASGRFWWRDQMDDGVKLKPWGAPLVRGVFAIAFEIPVPASISVVQRPHLVFEVSEISSHNVVTQSSGHPISALVYRDATLVTFIPHSDAFAVSFEQVGEADNGQIRGFLVMRTSVGFLGQTVVNAQYPAGTDVNTINQDDERKIFTKEEGRYMFTVSQFLSTPTSHL
jgi:hypothetical protein